MATSTFPTMTGATGLTEGAVFIPEIWSDETIAAYKKNLVLANLVRKISMKGKKGDTIHIPKPVRGSAVAKAENTAVTIQNGAHTEVTIALDKHKEYSVLIEDIVAVQALDSLRKFYTDDAGYAIAKQVDTDLFSMGTQLGNGADDDNWIHSHSYFIDASTSLTAYAVDTVTTSDVFTDAGFRKLIELMDAQDVPGDSRYLVIPPSLKNTMMGLERYVSSDFRDTRSVATGKLGSIYGIDIYMTTNAPVVETAAENAAGGALVAAMLFHKDTFVLSEQMGIRTQTQYKQEYLANLMTADMLYGVQCLRPESGFALIVNA
jgi:N4-gp56 family major capsid protein